MAQIDITFEHRAQAVDIVLRDLNTLSPDNSVLVIGGHAISHCVTDGSFRNTRDVDLLSNIAGAPNVAKAALLGQFPERYSSRGEGLWLALGEGLPEIQVDILNVDMFGQPAATPITLRPLHNLSDGGSNNYYASPFDLLIAKMFSAPLRTRAKAGTDVDDIQALLRVIVTNNLTPTAAQTAWVTNTLVQEAELGGGPLDAVADQLQAVFGDGSEPTE